MPLSYGFVKCKVVADSYLEATRRRNEIQYHLHAPVLVSSGDGGTQGWDAAINVGTTDADDLLKYKLIYSFWHVLVELLRAAAPGFTDLTATRSLPALDFLRSDVLQGTGPWRDSGVMDGSDQPDPVASLSRLLNKARSESADVYIFGRINLDGAGCIQDVQMNQGSSTPTFFNSGEEDTDNHNAIWQDGAVFVDLGQPTFAAYFTIFTRQMVPTDDLGNPADNSHALQWNDEGGLIKYPTYEELK